MTKSNKQTRKIFQELLQTMDSEQKNLRKNLNKLVKKSAVEAEKLMRIQEENELKKMEQELISDDNQKQKTKKKGFFAKIFS